jgi:hypothetical protein
MWQCGLRFAHSERARNEAADRFEKFHDRPRAVPSVAPQPQAWLLVAVLPAAVREP